MQQVNEVEDVLSFGQMYWIPCFKSGEEIILTIKQGQPLPDHRGNAKVKAAMERLSKHFVQVTVAIVTYSSILDMDPRNAHEDC